MLQVWPTSLSARPHTISYLLAPEAFLILNQDGDGTINLEEFSLHIFEQIGKVYLIFRKMMYLWRTKCTNVVDFARLAAKIEMISSLLSLRHSSTHTLLYFLFIKYRIGGSLD